jgi:hypothetical protein
MSDAEYVHAITILSGFIAGVAAIAVAFVIACRGDE